MSHRPSLSDVLTNPPVPSVHKSVAGSQLVANVGEGKGEGIGAFSFLSEHIKWPTIIQQRAIHHMLQSFAATRWDFDFSESNQLDAINSLENGQVLHFPDLPFELQANEQIFLSPHYVDPRTKNIGYDACSNRLWGTQQLGDHEHQQLKGMLARFSRYAHQLVQRILPHYNNNLTVGRTSFRPVEISNRKTSYRKDDKRLHVDAFPSAPNQGKRILRVFSNINPHGESRVWRLGEPFEMVAKRFLPRIYRPFPGTASALRFLRITKSQRNAYDHYMLRMHDLMKADEKYQQEAEQQEVRFAPNQSWIVQTDHVSHAVMSGQYLLEQTFYLPVSAMQDESKSPLRVLEKLVGKKLT